jgi:hypothetical protein
MSFASFYFLNSEQTMCCPPSIIRKKKRLNVPAMPMFMGQMCGLACALGLIDIF